MVVAKQDLKDTQEANCDYWKTVHANAKIIDNEIRIADLKVKMNKAGNTFDGMYQTRIEKLEVKNIELNQN